MIDALFRNRDGSTMLRVLDDTPPVFEVPLPLSTLEGIVGYRPTDPFGPQLERRRYRLVERSPIHAEYEEE